jgi:hypothetical protein
MPARIGRSLLWFMFVWFAWQSVATAGYSIYWAAERNLGDALVGVLVTIICGVIAREFWRGLGRLSVRH